MPAALCLLSMKELDRCCLSSKGCGYQSSDYSVKGAWGEGACGLSAALPSVSGQSGRSIVSRDVFDVGVRPTGGGV